MRILFIVGKFPVLSQTFILNQITGLIDHGHEVDIDASMPEDTNNMHLDVRNYNLLDNTRYRSVPRNIFVRLFKRITSFAGDVCLRPAILGDFSHLARKCHFSAKTLYEALPFMGRSSYDIIHCHFGPNGNRGAQLLRRGILSGKLVTAFHGFDLTASLRDQDANKYAELFETGNLFLPISERWKRRLIDLGCNENKIFVHRMGLDCSRFRFKPRKVNDGGPIHLVSVARLVKKKGLQYGIRAVAEVAKKRLNIKYMIVGDGPSRGELESLVEHLNAANTISMVGWKTQHEVVEILDNAHILLAPSVTSKKGDQEGIPVALMEAMAMGLPVVSSQHSGIPELIQDGVTGLLAPERDVAQLVQKLLLLLDHPDHWAEMGRHARQHVETYYNIDHLNNKLVEMYQMLLAEGP